MASRLSNIVLFFALSGMLIAGIGAVAFSQIPFDWLKPHVDSLSVDGDAEKFTPATFLRITTRIQWAGIGLLLFWGLMLWQRNYLREHLTKQHTELSHAFVMLGREIQTYFNTFIQNESRVHMLLLAILLIGGVLFRLAFLFQPMRHDEAFTFTNYASKPLMLALSNYSFPNNHLFHTFCAHISYLIFGNQAWAIRLPAFLAGVLTIPATYVLARALYNSQTALFATCLVAFSSALIEYATNARGYALMICFFLAISLLALSLQQKNNRAAWLLFAILSAFGLHTVPVMLYPFVAVLAWIFLSSWQNDFSTNMRQLSSQLIFTGIVTVCLTGIFYLPVMLGSGLDAVIKNRFVQSVALSGFITSLPHALLQVWTQWTRDFPQIIAIGLGLLAVFGLITHKHRATHHIPFVAIIPLTLIVLLTLQTVLPPPRVWLFLLPIFFILVGAGLSALIDKIPFKFATLLCVFALAITTGSGAAKTLSHYYPYGPGTLNDAEEITQYLQTYFQPKDRLLTIATAAPLEYYFIKHAVPIAYLRRPIAQSERIILLVLEHKYTLQQVLQTANLPDVFAAPQLIKTYPSARLYILKRKKTAHQIEPPSQPFNPIGLRNGI